MSHAFQPRPLARLLTGSGLLALLSLAPVMHAGAANPPSAAHSALRIYDIPAQDLAGALLGFGQQSGLQVGAPSPLLAGKQAPRVQGRMSAVQALDQILAGSGLVWRVEAQGVRIVAPEREAGMLELGNTLVQGRQTLPMGTQVVGRQQIEGLPAGNGDITSLLKLNPNVQFDDAQLSSKTPGEIAPANISINGAKFYQNAFVVDGMNINNNIDPAASNPSLLDSVPGRSQGLALDTDLLEEVKVLDSNVPAAYGQFTGGVVEATTRMPSKALHGKLSYQMTRSEWTEYHIAQSQEESFRYSSSHDEQPKFEKTIVRGTLEGHVTDTFGLLANFTQKRSIIPLSLYSAHHVENMGFHEEEQQRQIDNYFLKAVWQASDAWQIESSLTYAPEENHYFRSNTLDSGFDTQLGGLQTGLKAIWRGDLAKVEQQLAWGRIEQSRESDSADYFSWSYSESKDWGTVGSNPLTRMSLQGGYGDIEQRQDSWQYRVNADWSAFLLGDTRHAVQSGLELGYQDTHYRRLTDTHVYVTAKSTNTCTNALGVTDTVACALGTTARGWPGQYLSSTTYYRQGEFTVQTTSWGVWLQDEIQWGRLSLRPGIRVDGDDYMDEVTVAPRFAATYDVLGDGATLVTAGANRYYGRNAAAWQLEDGRNMLRSTLKRNTLNDAWTETAQAANTVKFNQLDIAYDDELVLGLTQQWSGVEYGLKYVNRKGRDQVIQVAGETLGQPSQDTEALSRTYTTYTNDGRSDAQVVSFTATPLQPIRFAGTRSSLQLALDWTEVASNYADYSEELDEDYYHNPYIRYDGEFIRYAERPAGNYARPWTARLSGVTEIPGWNLTVSNFFRYRAGYRDIGKVSGVMDEYQGVAVEVWEETDYGAALTWDLRLGWEIPTGKQQALFINLDVFNVLDEQVVSSVQSSAVATTPSYDVGRQYWLEVGYRF